MIDCQVLEFLRPEARPIVVAAPEVELLEGTAPEGILLKADLADESNVVAFAPKERRVGLVPLRFRQDVRRGEADLMDALVLAVHETSAAGHANRCHDMGLSKANALSSEVVDVRRFEDRMSCDS